MSSGLSNSSVSLALRQARRDATARGVLMALLVTGVVASAIVAKRATGTRTVRAAAMLGTQTVHADGSPIVPALPGQIDARPASLRDASRGSGAPDFVGPPVLPPEENRPEENWPEADQRTAIDTLADPSLRWFHGRPVRPVRVLWMKVTAYSPDERSCPGTADGRTATMHCVSTNNWHLVAADPDLLPMGSMLTVPGYGKLASGEEPIVPVLDRGSAIKGERLDVLFPTHEEAMQWGVQELPVTIWAYADGEPPANPRAAR